MNWKRWPWPDAGSLPLLIVAMRVCWIWPWLQTLSWMIAPGAPALLPLWAIVALLTGSALTAQAAPRWAATPRRARIWATALGLAAIFFVLWWQYSRDRFPLWDVRWLGGLAYDFSHLGAGSLAAFTAFILAAFLWLRGMQDSAAPTHDAWRAFGTGFWALALLLLVVYVEPALTPPRITLWLVLFFVAGMAALAIGGLQLARDIRRPNASLRLNRHWLAAGITLIALVIGLGLLLGLVITPEGMLRTFGWVGTILRWIGIIIGYVLLAFVYVLALILTPLIGWLRSLIQTLPAQSQPLTSLQRLFEQLQNQKPLELPAAVDESLRWLGLFVVIALIALAFALALRFVRRGTDEAENETRESVLTQDLLASQMAALWQRIREHVAGLTGGRGSPFLPLDGEDPWRRSIRASYQAFLLAMRQRSLPRPRPATPAEYAAAVEVELPAVAPSLDALTAAYLPARYAVNPPAAVDATAAADAWIALQAELAATPPPEARNPKPPLSPADNL